MASADDASGGVKYAIDENGVRRVVAAGDPIPEGWDEELPEENKTPPELPRKAKAKKAS